MKEIEEHLKVLLNSETIIKKKLYLFVNIIKKTIGNGNKILIFGNGGSASDSIHFAAELAGKFKKKTRIPLPAISLSENISTITAIGNDFNFSEIYSRQIKAVGKKGDLAIGISTSGKSKNILKAFSVSKKMKINIASLTGMNNELVQKYSKINFNVQSNNTARIQELHIFFIHLICTELDKIY